MIKLTILNLLNIAVLEKYTPNLLTHTSVLFSIRMR